VSCRFSCTLRAVTMICSRAPVLLCAIAVVIPAVLASAMAPTTPEMTARATALCPLCIASPC
jgi:hypothetical protein